MLGQLILSFIVGITIFVGTIGVIMRLFMLWDRISFKLDYCNKFVVLRDKISNLVAIFLVVIFILLIVGGVTLLGGVVLGYAWAK